MLRSTLATNMKFFDFSPSVIYLVFTYFFHTEWVKHCEKYQYIHFFSSQIKSFLVLCQHNIVLCQHNIVLCQHNIVLCQYNIVLCDNNVMYTYHFLKFNSYFVVLIYFPEKFLEVSHAYNYY